MSPWRSIEEKMKNLRKELEEGRFHQLYLLTGPEDYLRRQYRDQLKEALIPPDSPGAEMNLHYFTGREAVTGQLIDLAETMPFFGERRLIILEDTELFKKGSEELVEYLSAPAPSACFMFVEKSADKRVKLYKLIREKGLIAEFDTPDERTLGLWCKKLAAEEGVKFGEGALSLLLTYAGPEMNHLKNELEKLIAYGSKKGSIEKEDIRELCIKNPEDTIFSMVDSIAGKNKMRTMELYTDLIKRRESPMKLLAMTARQYRILLGIKEKGSRPDRELASLLGIPPFFVRKYSALAAKLSEAALDNGLKECVLTEEAVKTGKIADQAGFETLLLTLLEEEKGEPVPAEG